MKKSPAERKTDRSMEDIFREGFEGVESMPSSKIWENLDRELDNQELNRYRKQVIWYRSVAAACLLLLCASGLFFWRYQPAGSNQLGDAALVATPGAEDPLGAVAVEQRDLLHPPRQAEGQVASVSEPFSEKQAKNRKIPQAPPTALALTGKGFSSQAVLEKGTVNKANAKRNTREAVVVASVFEEKQAPIRGIAGEKTEISGAEVAVGALKAAPEPTGAMAGAPERNPTALGADSLSVPRAATILAQKKAEVAEGLNPTPEPAGKKEDQQGPRGGRWSLAMAYVPQYAYTPASLGSNAAQADAPLNMAAQPRLYEQYQEAVDEYNKTYTPGYSYSAMVGASYKLNDKWQVEGGLLYSQNEASTHHTLLIRSNGMRENSLQAGLVVAKAEAIFSNATREMAGGNVMSITRTDEYNIKYKFQQVGVPVRLAYRHDINKLYAFASGGLNLSLMIRNSITPDNEMVEAVQYKFQDEESPFRAWQWAVATSVGLGYDLNRMMSVVAGPELTYSITPILKGDQQSTDNYKIGVSVGARWRISR
ncbi:outer membrane beta-barrel protein [Rufibacter ruber]|uniref:outer membrane beta-barrel protein n=1 Tax=Rufibacter ruber TaxID=1783499 RepID=UPI0009EDFDB4|nr:outer membrane beta-barrel protein [Rufibacter ruber]